MGVYDFSVDDDCSPFQRSKGKKNKKNRERKNKPELRNSKDKRTKYKEQ